MATWIKDVETILIQLGGEGSVASITEKVRGIRFFSKNRNFRNSVNTTLHKNTEKFQQRRNGVWALVS